LLNNLIDLFMAGMETTSSSLMWTFLFFLHHPDVQEKVHKELDEVYFNKYILNDGQNNLYFIS
jgi:cytochrome P450